MAEMRFVVKNLAAEELVLVTGPDMMTLGDIRRATRVRWHLPNHLQRLICSGREYVHHPDSHSIADVLRGTVEGPNQERIIWLVWMREQDYACVGRGGLFLEDQLPQKRRLMEERGDVPFEYVTLRAFVALDSRAISNWRHYKRSDSDDEE